MGCDKQKDKSENLSQSKYDRLSEAMDIGLFEYFDSGFPCFMEWPEMIQELLPEETLKVQILTDDENTRRLLF